MATDKEVLRMSDWEYDSMSLKRVYYSAFTPIKGTPMENCKPETLNRQNRLYNADFLLRDYGFKLKEFDIIMENGMLPGEDPKLAMAKATMDFREDINESSYEHLIRIPGIGKKTALKILHSKEKITKYEQLDKFGVFVERAKPFIKIGLKRQTRISDFA